MGKSSTTAAEHGTSTTELSSQIETDFAGADPHLLTLVRMLVAENASIKAGILELREALNNANALADQDPLCPVLNRRAFLRELKREIARAERHKRDLSVLFVDLNDFKKINDEHGHDAGDRILIRTADALLSAVRKTDLVARLGGDEFGVLLIEAGSADAQACAAALQSPLAARKLGIAASIGIANWQPGQGAEELIRAADHAMFAQKKAK